MCCVLQFNMEWLTERADPKQKEESLEMIGMEEGSRGWWVWMGLRWVALLLAFTVNHSLSLPHPDFWLKSVSLHTIDTKDNSCAPVFLVGTVLWLPSFLLLQFCYVSYRSAGPSHPFPSFSLHSSSHTFDRKNISHILGVLLWNIFLGRESGVDDD